MMMPSDKLPFEIWDVFTDTAFAGNPLAIVETGGDLTTAQMQILARQFNLSETIFLMPPRDAAHTARARIFFPTAEIPFAGHPTIGAALSSRNVIASVTSYWRRRPGSCRSASETVWRSSPRQSSRRLMAARSRSAPAQRRSA